MINLREQTFCFATLAFGKKYRALATLLAQDLECYSPTTPLVILTDKPECFDAFPNVLPFKHRPQGITCYHDKRFAIARGLDLCRSCIFLDADMRVLDTVPVDRVWEPGIVARSCASIVQHNTKKVGKQRVDGLAIVQSAAQKLGVAIDEAKYVNEFLFVVTQDSGKEAEFLKVWDQLAILFELRGMHNGEGNAIGLAASKAGMAVHHMPEDPFLFFKDRIENVRIKSGKADPLEKVFYFKKQRMLEHQSPSPLQRMGSKTTKFIRKTIARGRLRLKTWENPQFYQ